MRAVLFDMDGTLTDSEKLWTVALERLAEELGGSLSEAARAAMVGQAIEASIRLLFDDLGIDGDHAAATRRLLDLTEQIFGEGLPWRPGARELLHAVREAGLRTALVTATHRRLVETALETLGRDRFDAVVCGDEVSRGKPDPEPYRRAMELLGVGPQDCLAVEDSPTGTRAAADAGAVVLVVPSEVAVPQGPGRVFESTLETVDVARLREIHATGRALSPVRA
ncbi:HAD family phosphatase [Nakamurella sp. YIM 132084]|uniref:HAD family phosphatase n=1 Tax=Nakamurella leprariae TaxID=2803911 RepID=A0A939BXY6_9ACTN|nr:HAD family phosphatase [Nakamurella leprariae]